MRKPILLIAALAAALALAQTARDERTQQAQGGAGTGRTEQSTGISGTAGSPAEVKNAEGFIQQASATLPALQRHLQKVQTLRSGG